jgi:signal transduction histidine kinase
VSVQGGIMENVVELFGQKIDTLRRRIPADELRIRQELDLLAGYWREIVTKAIGERESLWEEKLKLRDEELRRLNTHLFQREREWGVELSRKLEEERELLRKKLELKEGEHKQRETKLLQREDELRRRYQEKQPPSPDEILVLKAEIETLKLKLINQATELAAESRRGMAAENENFINLTGELREKWAAELNKKLGQQYNVMMLEINRKEEETIKLKKEVKTLQGQITYEHLPWEARVEALEKENEVLRIDMRKELIDKITGLKKENEEVIDFTTKQRESAMRELKTTHANILDIKEKEVTRLKDQIANLESQITDEYTSRERRVEFLKEENMVLKTQIEEKDEIEREMTVKLEKIQDTEKEAEELKTQLNEIQSILKRKDETFNVFFENISRGFGHRLRNYLGIINSAVQSCQLNVSSCYNTQHRRNFKIPFLSGADKNVNKLITELKKNFGVIVPTLNNIAKVSEEFSDFAQISKVSLAPVLPVQILENVYSVLKDKCRKQNVELIKQYRDGLPKIMADQNRLQEAFSSIAFNSIESMPHGGKLTIQAELDETKRNIMIKFMDTGQGISDRILDKIFQPFFTNKKEKKGVGLPKAKRIIESHQGSINIESKKNEGTTVTVVFPVT